MIFALAWTRFPVIEKSPPTVRLGNVVTWRPGFCARRDSRRRTSAAGTRRTISFILRESDDRPFNYANAWGIPEGRKDAGPLATGTPGETSPASRRATIDVPDDRGFEHLSFRCGHRICSRTR